MHIYLFIHLILFIYLLHLCASFINRVKNDAHLQWCSSNIHLPHSYGPYSYVLSCVPHSYVLSYVPHSCVLSYVLVHMGRILIFFHMCLIHMFFHMCLVHRRPRANEPYKMEMACRVLLCVAVCVTNTSLFRRSLFTDFGLFYRSDFTQMACRAYGNQDSAHTAHTAHTAL